MNTNSRVIYEEIEDYMSKTKVYTGKMALKSPEPTLSRIVAAKAPSNASGSISTKGNA